MNLLIDTHALLWFLAGDTRLSTNARTAIEDLGNTRLFSVASAWEIAIKVSLGKLALTGPFEHLIPNPAVHCAPGVSSERECTIKSGNRNDARSRKRLFSHEVSGPGGAPSFV